MFYAVGKEFRSLRHISKEAHIGHSIEISKQGMDNRYSQASVDFSKRLLEESLASQIQEDVPILKDSKFKRVLIKDSTRFDIDKSLKEYYPSYGGQTSVAGVSVQFEYDLKSGKINDLELQSALDRDSADAIKKMNLIQPGDLIIRDLGYFHSDVLEYIEKEKAYYITRLHATTKVYLSAESKQEISFLEIYNQMKTIKEDFLDLQVYVGSKKRLPIRMVVCLLPEEVYQKRVRVRNIENKLKGYVTTQSFKDRAHFNIFLTNVDEQTLNPNEISRLYRVRWQIELIFKTWKSLIRVSDLRKIRLVRLQTTIYMNLLWIVVHWKIIQPCRNYYLQNSEKVLSIFKCVDTLQEMAKSIRGLLFEHNDIQKKVMENIFKLFSRNHWLEKRKNREYFGDLISLYI